MTCIWPIYDVESGAQQVRFVRVFIIGPIAPELSMGWVDPWVGLDRDFSVFRELGWVHYSKNTKNLKVLCEFTVR